ncbi:heavy metal-associated isoprenylated plant protein 28 [Cucurbita pepo subsp. pepo]|uniref:heavy metal-associated isoprenylated plant protein 28 n=1 Tax=Cucurbita pepo subsp. pepo TaxID=3664 RepID=UPI000C9D371E|nr:heavy metal-associated isoprenylated plant protein 28 [Cucurbita pepo subsp. pepo]
MTTLELRVHMDCPGCESKVRSSLQKLKGVDNVEIDMSLQKVTVTGWAEQKKVLKAVRKTGRRAELWQLPYNPEHGNESDPYPQHHLNGPVPNFYGPQPTSTYNYYKHGYDNHDQAHHQNFSTHSNIFGRQTGSVFSDDNVNNCSIM